MILKAILVAGGHGTRARPFTYYSPKPMIPIDGRPTIDYIIRYLYTFDIIKQIIIVCEFDSLGKQIINYFEEKETLQNKISFVEDKKQGTGGALLQVERYVANDECFLVWFADNLCALNINDLYYEYSKINNDDSIGFLLVRSSRHEETGRVILKNSDSSVSLVHTFVEKPIVSLDNPEALGIYLFNSNNFRYFHDTSILAKDAFNLSFDFLAKLPKNKNLYSYDLSKHNIDWIDIESVSFIDRNKSTIEKIIKQMNFKNSSTTN